VIAVPFIGFAVVALLAIAFATYALWRHEVKGGALLAGAIALFMLGVGGGTYWMVGRPALATRAAQGLTTHDVAGLVPYLIKRVRQYPQDVRACANGIRNHSARLTPAAAARELAKNFRRVNLDTVNFDRSIT
jgi:hypothetical protein